MRNLFNKPSNEKVKFKKTKSAKAIIIAVALGLATPMLSGCRAFFSGDSISILRACDDENDDFEDTIPILDENGKQIDLSEKETLVFYDGVYKGKDDKVEVFALNTTGETVKGIIPKNYLEKVAVIDADMLEKYNCIYRVSNNGNDVNFRSSPDIKKDNIKSELEDGTCFLGDSKLICNKDASVWIPSIIISDDGFEEGFIKSDYAEREDGIGIVANSHNKFLKDKKIMVVAAEGSSLRLRTEDRDTSNNDNIITEIPDGSIVYVIDGKEVQKNGITWIEVEYRDSTNEYITGWVSKDYLKDANIIKKCVKDGVTLNLRNKPNIDSTILAKIQGGTVLEIPEVIFKNAEKNGDYYWTKVILEDGTEGYVATAYLEKLVTKEEYEAELTEREKLVEEIRKRTEINSNGNVTGIDVGFITGENLGKILDDEHVIGDTVFNKDGVEYYSADLGKKINFAIIEIGAMSQSSSKIYDRPNYLDCMKECEKRKIPFGPYFYSTAINIEEADKEIAYILDCYSKMESIGLKYDLLPFVLDRESGSSLVEDRKLYPGIDTSEITAYLINKLRERLPSEVVLYGGGKDLGGEKGQTVLDIDKVNSLLNDGLVNVYPALHRTKDGSSIADPLQKERIEKTKSEIVIKQCILNAELKKNILVNLNEINKNTFFEEILSGKTGKKIKEPNENKDNNKEEDDKEGKKGFSLWDLFK